MRNMSVGRVLGLAAALLVASVGTIGAQEVAVVTYQQSIDRIRVVYTPPAFTTATEIYDADGETMNAWLSKLACMDSASANGLLRSQPKTAAAWRSALENAPACDKRIGGVDLSIFEVRKVPWYHPTPPDTSVYKVRSAEAFRINRRPYVAGGFGGDLDKLAAQMAESTVTRVGGQRVVRYTYQDRVRANSGLNTADADEFIKMILEKRCEAMDLPAGTIIARNTGVGIAGLNRIYEPTGQTLTVARCKLTSGVIVDVAEHCSNLMFPLMGASYTFFVPVARRQEQPTPCQWNSNIPATSVDCKAPKPSSGIPCIRGRTVESVFCAALAGLVIWKVMPRGGDKADGPEKTSGSPGPRVVREPGISIPLPWGG